MVGADQARNEIWSNLRPDKKFHLADISRATNNFSKKLGEGDSAIVYKGHIHGHRVAVKVRKPHSRQEEKAFMAEIVVLSKYGNHDDIVGFVGCFLDEHGKIGGVVYKYMSNKSLGDHLHGSQTPLSWGRLLHILIGVGNGLAHLHSHGVVHRDIRPPNILLDGELIGKISDFGICKVPHQPPNGYLATPVYPQHAPWTTDGDVFEFGTVLFEVLHWKHARNQRHELEDWANKLIEKGGHCSQREMEALHERWKHWEPISVKSRHSVEELAFRCVQRDASLRPTMAVVVNDLRHALKLQPHGR